MVVFQLHIKTLFDMRTIVLNLKETNILLLIKAQVLGLLIRRICCSCFKVYYRFSVSGIEC